MTSNSSHRLYTPVFLVLCTSYGLFGASFNMIIPELPAYLSSLGGEDYKGYILALFTLTAGFSRPFSGKLTDTIGRRPVIILGMIVCIVCSMAYPLIATVGGFLLLRLIHGFSTGFSPTAITAYVADIVPVHRRGEAMGIIGVSINVGSSISPPLGGFLSMEYGLEAMFAGSSILAFLALVILAWLPETLEHRQRFSFKLLQLNSSEIIDRRALYPALVCGLSYMGFGGLLTITPDQCTHLGMANKGLFFSSFTLCSILSRVFAGSLSDRIGRLPVMRWSIVLLAISYMILGQAYEPWMLIAATGLLGFCLGLVIPVVFAWTVDRSDDESRGRALATLFIGLEIAIGLGALISAEIYANQPSNYSRVFLIIGVITLLGLIFVREGRRTPYINEQTAIS